MFRLSSESLKLITLSRPSTFGACFGWECMWVAAFISSYWVGTLSRSLCHGHPWMLLIFHVEWILLLWLSSLHWFVCLTTGQVMFSIATLWASTFWDDSTSLLGDVIGLVWEIREDSISWLAWLFGRSTHRSCWIFPRILLPIIASTSCLCSSNGSSSWVSTHPWSPFLFCSFYTSDQVLDLVIHCSDWGFSSAWWVGSVFWISDNWAIFLSNTCGSFRLLLTWSPTWSILLCNTGQSSGVYLDLLIGIPSHFLWYIASLWDWSLSWSL